MQDDQQQAQPDARESGVDDPHELAREAARQQQAAPPVGAPAGADLEQRVAILEEQQARLTRAARLMLEGKWTGELPTAAGEVDALMGGGVSDFHPVEFPPKD